MDHENRNGNDTNNFDDEFVATNDNSLQIKRITATHNSWINLIF